MRKIRKYRVNIRPSVVGRLLKNTYSLPAEKLSEIEELIGQDAELLKKSVEPAAVYETYPVAKLPLELQSSAQDKKIFWVSLAAATLGEAGNNFLSGLNPMEERYQVRHCLLVEFLDQAVNFIPKLILEELGEKDVLLEKSERVETVGKLSELARLLPLDKIGIVVDDGKLRPDYSAMALYYWQSRKRR